MFLCFTVCVCVLFDCLFVICLLVEMENFVPSSSSSSYRCCKRVIFYGKCNKNPRNDEEKKNVESYSTSVSELYVSVCLSDVQYVQRTVYRTGMYVWLEDTR